MMFIRLTKAFKSGSDSEEVNGNVHPTVGLEEPEGE